MNIGIDSKKLALIIKEEIKDLNSTPCCVSCTSVIGEFMGVCGKRVQLQITITDDEDELIEVGNDICIEINK